MIIGLVSWTMSARSSANARKLDANELSHRLGPWSGGDGPLYLQLASAIATLIDEGVLGDGDLLPAERSLAAELSVSRGTVVASYEKLSELGAVQRRQGSGTRVVASSASYRALDEPRLSDSLFDTRRHSIDMLLAVNQITPIVFDVIQQVRLDARPELLDSSEPAGLAPLRVAIAEHFTRNGLPTTAEQIVVTNGAQQAVALLVDLVVRPGDVVLTESTTWPGLVDLVRSRGARVHGVAMDHDGIVVDDLIASIDRLRPTLIALNPHHHNPTGSRLAAHRRPLVADAAADYGVPLLEDRVVASLAFDHHVAPPLAACRPDGVNFVADSINKVAWPGLRIGWVRADAQAIHQLRARKAAMDLFAPLPSQLMALAVLENFDRIRADRVAQLEHRSRVLADALSAQLPTWRQHPVRGGLVTWVELPEGAASDFARFAARFGVSVAGSREFASSSYVDDHLRLPYTNPPAQIEEAVRRLAAAWAAYEPGMVASPMTSELATASLV
ncbi:MAG: PLP-dependent aminotransferase family protein [Acidimicrobiales bacterium]